MALGRSQSSTPIKQNDFVDWMRVSPRWGNLIALPAFPSPPGADDTVDALSLSGMDRLTSIQNELVEVSAQASALLAWYLQLKDAQTQDSET